MVCPLSGGFSCFAAPSPPHSIYSTKLIHFVGSKVPPLASKVHIVSCSLESLLVIPDNFLSEYVDHARQLTMDTRSSKKVLAYPSRQDVLPVCSLSLQSHPHCPTGSSSGVIVRCGSWRTLVNHQRLRLCPRVNSPKASLSVPISLPATGDDS